MKNLFIPAILLSSFITNAQNTGINTTLPHATFQIDAKNTDGSTAEGIIIPKLTGNQLKTMTTNLNGDHNGLLVYVSAAVTIPDTSTQNVTYPGYYRFNITAGATPVKSWVKLEPSGLEKFKDSSVATNEGFQFINSDNQSTGKFAVNLSFNPKDQNTPVNVDGNAQPYSNQLNFFTLTNPYFDGTPPLYAKGDASTVIGVGNSATNFGSVAVGIANVVSGHLGFATGIGNYVKSGLSHAIGLENYLSDQNSGSSEKLYRFAFGNFNQVFSQSSFAIGEHNVINGKNSFSFGQYNNNDNQSSYSLGFRNHLSADFSFALGQNLKTLFQNETVLGYYNFSPSAGQLTPQAPLFTVGNGYLNGSTPVDSNALIILRNANTGIGLNQQSPSEMLDVNGNLKVRGKGVSITDGQTCSSPGSITYGTDGNFYGCIGTNVWKKLNN